MKKVVTIFAVCTILISTEASACSICVPVQKAWDSFVEYMEKVSCQKAQIMWGRVSGKYGICEHNGKHQLYSK